MQHPLNRHLFIADSINLLRRIDNETIDRICIAPLFAKNQTFTGNLKPPLTVPRRQFAKFRHAGDGASQSSSPTPRSCPAARPVLRLRQPDAGRRHYQNRPQLSPGKSPTPGK